MFLACNVRQQSSFTINQKGIHEIWTQQLWINAKMHTVNNSDWVLSSSKLMSLKIVLFWETLSGEVMGNPKKNHKVGLSVVSKLIWPASLPAISTLGSTFGRRPACNLGNIYHPPKFMPHLAAVSRWTSDLPCNMNPALLLLGLFFFYTAADGEAHTHTFADTHAAAPRGAISPPLSTFPVSRSQFLLIWHQLLHSPRVHLKVAFI